MAMVVNVVTHADGHPRFGLVSESGDDSCGQCNDPNNVLTTETACMAASDGCASSNASSTCEWSAVCSSDPTLPCSSGSDVADQCPNPNSCARTSDCVYHIDDDSGQPQV